MRSLHSFSSFFLPDSRSTSGHGAAGCNGYAYSAPSTDTDSSRQKGAIVTFSGGVYTFTDWDVREDGKLYFTAPSEIRISGKLNTNNKASLVPAPNVTSLSARDIVIIVTGSNASSSNLEASQKAVEFGEKNTVIGMVYVPNGTLQLGQKTNATGVFIAKWVITAQDVDLDGGF